MGCGPQEEFRACADITISGKATDDEMIPPEPDTTQSTTVTPVPPQETSSPVTSLIISLVSFLVVFLILFLLYFHFYRVGEKIKNWIKDDQGKGRVDPPLPPPRNKKQKSESDARGLDEIDLKADSLA